MKVYMPSNEAIAVLLAISRSGFDYALTKAICNAAGWGLVDDELDLGYIRFAMHVENGLESSSRLLSVWVAENGHTPWAFVPLFYFEEYEQEREPFDDAFRSLSAQLTGLLGEASRVGTYGYPHRVGWSYYFAGWALADATLLLVQDELDIQFGMDVTLWVQPSGTMIEAPVKYE